MSSVESKLRDLLALAQSAMDELPVGFIVLSASGRPLWYNREADIVCSVWNQTPLRADALPLSRTDFVVPPPIWAACQELLSADKNGEKVPKAQLVQEPERGLYATVRLHPRSDGSGPPACFVQLDYRRPRGDRDRPVSPAAFALLARLTFREREVALRLRDGLTTSEISKELKRSQLTIKTQLAAIYRKFGVTNRAKVTALLNR